MAAFFTSKGYEMTTEIKELVEQGLQKVETELKEKIEKFEADVAQNGKAGADAAKAIEELSTEFKAINDIVTELAQKHADGFESQEVKDGSVGEQFIKSEQFKNFAEHGSEAVKARVEVKNTVTSDDATTTWSDRRTGIIAGDFAPLTIRDVIPSMSVSSNLVETMKEDAWTNAAAETGQTLAKPESDLTFTKANVAIETIPHFIKVSNQLIQDAPAVRSYIDVRLLDGLAQREDAQLLNGNGTSPNISGLTDAGNFTAFTADSGASLVESINKAKYQLWAIGRQPDVAIVNPADWGAQEIVKGSDGHYLYGLPGMNAGVNPFGVRIVLSNNMAAGNFLVASMRTSAIIYNRQGAVVEMGYVNDDFTKNLVTIRAEKRMALGVDRASGILYGAFTAA